ncbi:uncharacterized mitochondrial protein AtMg00810-like [Nicotiana tomentosiformis]|uniref:uncharacterized mitochondrial protein AtMg00810-like n=1 Tax=Nicotiana tomentosiformis TaxID=4098 RepID=UPI00388C36C6
MVTVRSVSAIVASRGWNISQMDEYNAFLGGDLYEEVYIELPQDFRRQRETKVMFKDFMTTSCSLRKKGEDFVAVLIYVDDLLITGNSTQFISETKVVPHQQFKVKDLGDLKYFLGIEVLRSKSGILLNQRKYCLQLIFDLGLGGAKTVSIPIDLNQKFTSTEFDRHTRIHADLSHHYHDRYYILQCKLSQFMQEPKKSHWGATVRVVKYIKQEPGMRIFLCRSNGDSLTRFCDADWASCPNTRRSVTVYLIKFGDSLISWKSKKQHIVSRSSAEAEYRSLVAVTAEIVWLLGLFAEFGVIIKQHVNVYCDTKASLQFAVNPIFHERTKHIEIDCYFVLTRLNKRTHASFCGDEGSTC